MDELQGRVSVITGAASGFGRELAILCAQAGMKLVLADVDDAGLEETVGLLEWPGGGDAEEFAVRARCNVAEFAEVEMLANLAWDRFGGAHLLFNNAGVAVAGPAWSTTQDDWDWVLGVNLMGVVHGIRAFVPRMIASKQPCHVVNTASVAGLTSVPGSSVYCVSKFGVVTLSECLYHDLQLARADIGVSVLCPAFVPTGIADAGRNRPADKAACNPLAAPFEAAVKEAVKRGRLSARDVAEMTMAAVRENRFYIVTHEKSLVTVRERMEDILELRHPTNPMKMPAR